MSVIGWIAIGLVGGVVVGWLAGGRGRPLLGDMAAATLGAVLGGFIASVTLGLNVADVDMTSLFVAALGAAVLLLILHVLPTTEIYD